MRDARATEVDDVRALLREYAQSLPFALDFQHFDDEVAALPGEYAPPRGALLLALDDDGVCGCVGLRPLGVETCEMKRLFVRPQARRTGAGRSLVEAAVNRARDLGYRRMRLDTTPGMEAAQRLYADVGFRDTEPYTANPVPGARFLELEL